MQRPGISKFSRIPLFARQLSAPVKSPFAFFARRLRTLARTVTLEFLRHVTPARLIIDQFAETSIGQNNTVGEKIFIRFTGASQIDSIVAFKDCSDMTGKDDVAEEIGFRRLVAHHQNAAEAFPFKLCADTGEKITFGVEF